MDFEAWRCKHEKEGENMFCPEEGCSKEQGCARERGWLPSKSSGSLSDAVKAARGGDAPVPMRRFA